VASKEQIFQRKVKELIAHAGRLEDEAVRRAITILNDARKEVAATVASTEWQAYHLPQMKSAIERSMTEFGAHYGVDLRDVQRSFWEQGIDRVDMPLRQVGIIQAIPEIDTAMLSVMQGFSTDLVKGLTQDAIKRISQELTLGLIGQKTPYEVMGAIGRNLKDKSIFKSIAHRAETITRTEAGRVLEAAGQARKEAAAKVVPGMQKMWWYGHSPKMPRLDHMAAHGQIRDVDEPFDVGGEELMYPRDPAGSAANTINCGCTSIPYHPRWDIVTEENRIGETGTG
jgi:hypothetical protein